ncbi:MAG: hypothetical protein FJ368_03165 [Pelagibacterales bacterium]|nr:hypothetical protein [Pelagibacterales bacterium]
MEKSLKELQTENKFLSQKLTLLQKNISEVKNRISDNQKLINNLSRDKIIISEHAILRILERRYGQEQIIKQVVEALEKEIGDCPKNCKLILDGDLQAVIENGILITVIPL